MLEHAGSAEHAEHYDPEANKIGMWLFLTTEILLFGVLFIAYAVYYSEHRRDFKAGSAELDLLLGAVNTAVLLTSSLTMALAIHALRRGRKAACLALLGATIGCALLFLVLKSSEWSAKFGHDLYPGAPGMVDRTPGFNQFIGLYYLSTGLHALHVIAGAFLLLLVLLSVRSGATHAGRPSLIENAGLYWHLGDLIWIYLFPLSSLIL